MVSIIVPVYNCEGQIEKCIHSILNQTYQDIELILVNDGSKDDSLRICEKCAEHDSRIKVYTQENQGPSKARNKGIRLAQGEYIQFVDSDDYIACDMVEKMLSFMKKETDIGIVICGMEELYQNSVIDIVPDFEMIVEVEELSGKYPGIFKKSMILGSPCNKLYLKDKITEFFDEEMSLGEDLVFNLQYLRNINKIYFSPDILYYYMIDSQSLVRKYRNDLMDMSLRMYCEKKKFCIDYNVGEVAKRDISTDFIRFIIYGLSDLYALSPKSNKEKKHILHRRVTDYNVKEAIRDTEFRRMDQKIIVWLMKMKFVTLLDIVFKGKAILRKR